MKYLFELILIIIVVFFLWNILKRIFFSAFYKFPKPGSQDQTTTQKKKKNLDSKLNWDAETVDYEEIRDENEIKK